MALLPQYAACSSHKVVQRRSTFKVREDMQRSKTHKAGEGGPLSSASKKRGFCRATSEFGSRV